MAVSTIEPIRLSELKPRAADYAKELTYILAGQRKSSKVIEYDLQQDNYFNDAGRRAAQTSEHTESPVLEPRRSDSYKEVMTSAVDIIKTLRKTDLTQNTEESITWLRQAQKIIGQQQKHLDEQTTYRNNSRIIDHRLNKQNEPNYQPKRSQSLEKIAMMQRNFEKIGAAIEDLITKVETPKYHKTDKTNGSGYNRHTKEGSALEAPHPREQTTTIFNNPIREVYEDVPLAQETEEETTSLETKVHTKKTQSKKKGLASRLASGISKTVSGMRQKIRSYVFNAKPVFA